MHTDTVTAGAGRMAALEAIGDLLAVLKVPAADMLDILGKISEAATGDVPLREVARKVWSIAARVTESDDLLRSPSTVERA